MSSTRSQRPKKPTLMSVTYSLLRDTLRSLWQRQPFRHSGGSGTGTAARSMHDRGGERGRETDER